MFDPNAPCQVDSHLQKLKDMDNITVKTVSPRFRISSSHLLYNSQTPPSPNADIHHYLLQILLVLQNLETNLSVPQLEPVVSSRSIPLSSPRPHILN
jgi:hypothetical protein